jgi:four helix bundle protein
MKGQNIQERTTGLATRVLKLSDDLPGNYNIQVLSHQVVRSATSVGANYRAACRSKSRKDFINKLKTVEEELDETIYWLGLIRDFETVSAERMKILIDETKELLAIIVKSILTAKQNEKLNPRK